MNPMNAQWPMPGIAKLRSNRSPYASMMVSSKMMKPQNVSACATPGTVQRSSLRCPTTSVAWISTSRPGCSRTAAIRSGAGWPLRPTRYSHHTRRPATAAATAVRTRPTMMRRVTVTSGTAIGCKRTPGLLAAGVIAGPSAAIRLVTRCGPATSPLFRSMLLASNPDGFAWPAAKLAEYTEPQ